MKRSIPQVISQVLIYKEVARDWLNDPLATISEKEKVPIPVPQMGAYK